VAALNVAAYLPERAQAHPDKIAVHQWQSSLFGGAYRHISYGDLDRDSEEISRGLSVLGIGRGVRAVLMVPPGRDFFALAFGMAKAGVVPVLVDPGMGLSNLKQCIAEAAPQAFIGIPRAHGARVASGWGRETVTACVTVGGVGLFGGYTLDEVRMAGRAASGAALADTKPDELAAILFTSGSTGVPKGVMYTHANFAEQVQSLRRISDLGEGEVDLATFPPFALFDPALGMTTVVPDMDFARPASADPEKIVAAITEFGVTNLFCSPALLGVLARWGAPRGVKLPTLRRVVSAGAPVSARVIELIATMLDANARVITPYGATEALPVSMIKSDELLGEARARNASGAGVCVGRVVDGVELAIIGISDEPIAVWDEALRVPAGVLGEITVRGAVVTQGYYAREADTALAKIPFERGAWHRMGDLGYLDELGRLWFCGRKSERVLLDDGTTLTSVKCEAIFDAHPAVRRSALVGVQKETKTVPVLCVELAEDARRDRAAIEAELRALGAEHGHTSTIGTFLFHSGFPVDPRHNAKIRRAELARWAEEKLR